MITWVRDISHQRLKSAVIFQIRLWGPRPGTRGGRGAREAEERERRLWTGRGGAQPAGAGGRRHVGELLAWNNIDIKCPQLLHWWPRATEITNFVARHKPIVNIVRVRFLFSGPELVWPRHQSLPAQEMLPGLWSVDFAQILFKTILNIWAQENSKIKVKHLHSYWFWFGFPIFSAIPSLR